MTRTRVLIPLDGSEWSQQILAPIGRLLKPSNHELILLRVAQLPAGLVGAPPRPVSANWMGTLYESQHDLDYTLHPIYDSQQEQNERAALEVALLSDQQRLQRDGYLVTSQVRFGDPAEEIVSLARQAAVDMVAMATHGQTGLRHLLLGSVAEHVLRELTIPLLLIRPTDRMGERVPDRPVGRLTAIVPLDGSPLAEQAIDRAAKLPAIAGARLILVAVEPTVGDIGMAEAGVVPYWMLADHEAEVMRLNRYLRQIAGRLTRMGLTIETRLAEGSPADEILRVSAAEHADLIVMATRGRSGVERLLLGSMAARLLRDADLPVVLIRR